MKIPLNKIKIGPGRRALVESHVQELVRTFSSVGQLHPITVRPDYTLVSGLHRMEAARRLGWKEIDGNIRELDELHARLAEIDENIVRAGLSRLEMEDALAQRKEIYEALNPAAIARNRPGHVNNHDSSANLAGEHPVKSFAEDTAEKTGMSARAVQRHVWLSENTTPETKELLKSSERGRNITQEEHIKLARLKPEQQSEAARRYVSGEIDSFEEYAPSVKKPALQAVMLTGIDGDPHENPSVFVYLFKQVFVQFLDAIEELHYVFEPAFPAMTEELAHKAQLMSDRLCEELNSMMEDVNRHLDENT